MSQAEGGFWHMEENEKVVSVLVKVTASGGEGTVNFITHYSFQLWLGC